jgi:hypothetical protein
MEVKARSNTTSMANDMDTKVVKALVMKDIKLEALMRVIHMEARMTEGARENAAMKKLNITLPRNHITRVKTRVNNPVKRGIQLVEIQGPNSPGEQNPEHITSAEPAPQGTPTPPPQQQRNFEILIPLPSSSPLSGEPLPAVEVNENAEAKRPRGRPRKTPRPDDMRALEGDQAIELQTMTKGAENEEEEGASPPWKKGRGRPRKSEVDVEVELDEIGARAMRKAVEQPAAAAVVERKKRGRPPKKRDDEGQVVTS